VASQALTARVEREGVVLGVVDIVVLGWGGVGGGGLGVGVVLRRKFFESSVCLSLVVDYEVP
jgi:hypothetical protein